jgi:hypothetical protein
MNLAVHSAKFAFLKRAFGFAEDDGLKARDWPPGAEFRRIEEQDPECLASRAFLH